MQKPSTLCLTLASAGLWLVLTACGGPAPGAPANPPLWVGTDTGDRLALAEEQMGLKETASHTLEGDFPFGDAVQVTCGPAASGPHPAFRISFTSRDLELTVIVPPTPGGHDGEQQARAVLGRVGSEGGYLESDGAGTATIRSASERAGTFAASGTFQVELTGEAGQGAVSGSFERCYHFT